jgi:hypothetical protein
MKNKSNDWTKDPNYRPYISKEQHKKNKRNALLANANGDKTTVPPRPVTPHPEMQKHISVMQDTATNRASNGGSYSKKKYGRTPGTTKKTINARGAASRITYKSILTSRAKIAIKKYVETIYKDKNLSEEQLAVLIQKAITKASPNTTHLVRKDFVHTNKVGKPVATGAVITFTGDMFQRTVAHNI